MSKIEIEKLIVKPDTKINLKDYDTRYTGGFKEKKDAEEKLRDDIERLIKLQYKLYASNSHAVLIIFQAMDAAGKDGTIKHVMSGIDPQGCEVTSFKAPTYEELEHDFLWRCVKHLPERGKIGIFNRSYYEEVLVTRVHPEFILNQKLPGIHSLSDITDGFWHSRFSQINKFEKHLYENGTIILKFFLHVSKEEQKERFLKRINDPDKNWKFSLGDVHERTYWKDYQKAFEEAINSTSAKFAPWYIIPADRKWFMRMAVGNIIVKTLEGIDIKMPVLNEKETAELSQAKTILEAEDK
jgi:PPK2 family polyphosphate:nucleotide phosphotransferase